jgi:hypothetical protein
MTLMAMVDGRGGGMEKTAGRRVQGDSLPMYNTVTEVGYPREGTRQTVCERLNDVWVRSRSDPNRLHWNTTVVFQCNRSDPDRLHTTVFQRNRLGSERCFSIQFVQVLTNLWYSHTYNLSRYRAKRRPTSKNVTPPKFCILCGSLPLGPTHRHLLRTPKNMLRTRKNIST